ncbi:MAG: tRNA (N6-threonylcarbamoyladenosine(37)-N6)-methyltransferase TrmO [Candidatus Hermodarchaeia archaeon]|jgi:tRNA-Thr(GGU) m(6)t(6)A37 methyltransferase TsaA
MTFTASVVGYVRKPEDELIFIEIEAQYWEATLQVDQFSHIIVLWWITGHDNPTSRANLADFPPQDAAELSGVFASRSPARPTPIGLSIVAIQKIDKDSRRIYIDQIDAHDETPVVDIKPYMPFSDRVDNARYPIWFQDNEPRYTAKPV